MTIEAMKQALEALEEWEKPMSKGSLEAHRILRTAIAEAEKQEPVAWPCEIEEADFEKDTITLKMLTSQYVVRAGKHWLSTTPPAAQRQPLTKERIGQIIEQCKITLVNYCSEEKQIEFARAIEVAHGIKETNT
jgi:hypothetical protein